MKELGFDCGHRRIDRLMRQNRFTVKKNSKPKATTDGNNSFNIAPNHMNRNISANRPNQKWVVHPRSEAWVQGNYIPSILAAIGGVIERHMVAMGFLEGEGQGLKSDPQADAMGVNADSKPRGKACSSCGQFYMRMVEGCMTCASCGHSKCR